jgi:hypothetical protein
MKQWQNDNDWKTEVVWGKHVSVHLPNTNPPPPPIWTGLGLNPGLPGERPDEIEVRTSVSFLIHAEICANSVVISGSNTFILKSVTGQDVQPIWSTSSAHKLSSLYYSDIPTFFQRHPTESLWTFLATFPTCQSQFLSANALWPVYESRSSCYVIPYSSVSQLAVCKLCRFYSAEYELFYFRFFIITLAFTSRNIIRLK